MQKLCEKLMAFPFPGQPLSGLDPLSFTHIEWGKAKQVQPALDMRHFLVRREKPTS